MIYLLGLNGFSPQGFRDTLATLARDSAGGPPLIVVDARSSQFSRTDEYKGDLNALLPERTYYRWDPRLGGHPNDERLYREDGRIDYLQLRAVPFFREAMNEYVLAEREGSNIVMLCACRDAHTCHRVRAIGADLAALGLDAIELHDQFQRTSALAILDTIPSDVRDLSARPIPTPNRHAVPAEIAEFTFLEERAPSPTQVLETRLDQALDGVSASAHPRSDIYVLPVRDDDQGIAAAVSLDARVILDARSKPVAIANTVHLPLSPNPNVRLATLTGYANRHQPEHATLVLCDEAPGNTRYANGLRLAGTILNQAGLPLSYFNGNDVCAQRVSHQDAFHAVVKEQQSLSTPAPSPSSPTDTAQREREAQALAAARAVGDYGEGPSTGARLAALSDQMRAAFARAAEFAPDFAREPRRYAPHQSAVLFRAAGEFGALINMYNQAPFEVPVTERDGRTTCMAIKSSEALYQALRFGDLPGFQTAILRASHAMLAKQTAYAPVGDRPGVTEAKNETLVQTEQARAQRWLDQRVEVMRYVLRMKAAQNPAVRDTLLATGNRPIVEQSGTDPFWGAVSVNGALLGHNVVGALWEEIREDLRANPHALDEVIPPMFDPPLQLNGKMLAPYRRAQEREEQQIAPAALGAADREVMTYSGIGVSARDGNGITPDEEAFAGQLAARLYRANYALFSGLATASDSAFAKGVVEAIRADARGNDRTFFEQQAKLYTRFFIPPNVDKRGVNGYIERAKTLHVPYYVIDPTNRAHAWAYLDALALHPNPNALMRTAERGDDFALNAHARNMMILKGESGRYLVEFVLYIADMEADGLPKGGTRTGVAVAANYKGLTFRDPNLRIPAFNIRTEDGRKAALAYVSAIERGDIRFGDGWVDGKRFVYPREGYRGTGMTFDASSPLPPDLSYALLQDAVIAGEGTDVPLPVPLHRAYAYRATFTGCRLSGDLDYLYAKKATFDNVHLDGTARGMTLQEAAISDVQFRGDVRGTDFARSTLERTVFNGDVRASRFAGAHLSQVLFAPSLAEHVRNIDLSNAQCESITWSDEILRSGHERLGLKLTQDQRTAFEQQARERAQEHTQALAHAE